MASSAERRKGFWDDEDEGTSVSNNLGSKAANKAANKADKPTPVDAKTLDLKVSDATALLEQTHQLYMQYFNGIEKRPPVEKLRLLETRSAELVQLGKSVSAKFKVNQFTQHLNSMKDLWARKLRDKEIK